MAYGSSGTDDTLKSKFQVQSSGKPKGKAKPKPPAKPKRPKSK